MKIKHSIFLLLSFFLSSCDSCKTVSQPIYPSVSFLSNYQWHLISITNSDPSIATYRGTIADSMSFTWKWANNGNVLMDSIFYYQNSNTRKYSGNFLFGPPSQNSYIDTVQCFPNWKSGFSNAIIIRSIANNLLVFTVNNNTNTNTETDSLKRNN